MIELGRWKTFILTECGREFMNALRFTRDRSKIEGVQMTPHPQTMFDNLLLIEPSKVRVLILNDMPYPAMVNNGIPLTSDYRGSAPSYLQVMFEEIKRSCYMPDLNVGYAPNLSLRLNHWYTQGVLIFNMCPIRELDPDIAEDYRKAWEPFTTKFVLALMKRNNMVVVGLGKHVNEAFNRLEERPWDSSTFYNCHYISSPHPRDDVFPDRPNFTGSGLFNKINRALAHLSSRSIDWMILVQHDKEYALYRNWWFRKFDDAKQQQSEGGP